MIKISVKIKTPVDFLLFQECKKRDVTIQELIRVVIVPEWFEMQRQKKLKEEIAMEIMTR